MISPDEDDWLVHDQCNTALYMTQYFNMFWFWMFCDLMTTIIAIIYPSLSQMKRYIAVWHHPHKKSLLFFCGGETQHTHCPFPG